MPVTTDRTVGALTGALSDVPEKVLLAGVALSSFAALLLELTLTRIFSVILFYHFAFLAISIALLGLGAGGVFAHIRKPSLSRFELRKLAAALCTVNAIVIPIAFEIVLHIPVSVQLTRQNFLRLTAIYIYSAIPFFVTGIEMSVIFGRRPAHISCLYSADLAGGAMACLGVVPLLNWIGGPNAILVSAASAGSGGHCPVARCATSKMGCWAEVRHYFGYRAESFRAV